MVPASVQPDARRSSKNRGGDAIQQDSGAGSLTRLRDCGLRQKSRGKDCETA